MGNALGVYGNQVPEGHWESNVLGVYGNQVPLKHRGIKRMNELLKELGQGLIDLIIGIGCCAAVGAVIQRICL